MVRKLLAAAAGAAVARAALRELRGLPALERTNFRGRTVSLAGGPALAAGAVAGALIGAAGRADHSRADHSRADHRRTAARGVAVMGAATVAGVGAGAVGLYDDLVGGRPEHAAKGFRGHLSALKEGRVTSGLVKIAGVGAAGAVAAALLPRRRAVDVVLGAGVIAGAANLFNLLDLRPGRAIKAGFLVGVPLAAGRGGGVAAGALGAAGALLPADLGEEIMLGDAGANALGAVLGTAYVARAGTWGRLAALAGIVALTAASEKVSFTRVIEQTPALRALDQLGRLKRTESSTESGSAGSSTESGNTASSSAEAQDGNGWTAIPEQGGSVPDGLRKPSPRPRRQG